ncbi:prolyl oligopeptidase family serine peptidase [uncultured Aquimarina sp.]|uniref:prolyl oligopeptidase family serine peptidase n=1 Tax=uncultured Aquimarina sp. TaxID=575652 RepID=UPI002629886D|nr:prolyl oligopeptidase family serine peptidase [uncultured Aquimarina sp.]
MKFVFLSILSIQCLCTIAQDQMKLLPEKIVIDEYHNQKIKDPYRYAEDLNTDVVKSWIGEQNKISISLLNKIQKKQYLIDKQIEFDQKNEFSISKLKIIENDNHFYLKRESNENVPKLYYRKTFSSPEELLYDPKSFKSKSHIDHVINYIQPNWDGSKIVISITKNGQEVSEMVVLDVNSKKLHSEIIKNVWPSNKGGVEWLPDNTGFIYLQYRKTDTKSKDFQKNTKSVLHIVNDNPNDAKEIFSKNSDPNLNEDDIPITVIERQDSKYLIGKTPGAGNYYNSYYLPINEIKTNDWKPLFKKVNEIKSFSIQGDSIIYRTSKNAPNYKICITSVLEPNFDTPKVLVKENPETIITDFDITKDGLYFVTSKNGVKSSLYKLDGKTQKEIKLPQTYGNISISSKGPNYSELWINASGWTAKNIRYEYNNKKLSNKNLNNTINDKILENIIIEEIEVEAPDGEMIPLSILYKKGIKKGNIKPRPTLMDGYGAYGISMKPAFSLRRLLWILEGGIYAIAHVRGGGEKGDSWHKGGYKSKKPNTWKDFIACAEYLIDKNYTTKNKLAIWSGSAGGILIGRAITDRPDLFSAAIVEFGSLNMLRSEMRANGALNIKEFGTISDPKEFKDLLEIDAYHHIKDGTKYPSTLLTAGLNDARVPAWFSVKFAARMQKANISSNPNLLLIDKETGHGIDDTKLKQFNRFANILSFALWQTGHPDYQPE